LLDADRIDTLFERTATQQDTRELLCSSVVQLMSEVVLGVQPSVPAAYQAHQEELGVSTTALDNKLDRVETAVAAALVRDSARLATPVVQALGARHPRWVPGSTTKILDGNHFASTEHRLQEWRDTWAAPLPGQALVVLDQQRLVMTAVFLDEDGHAQERRGIAQVLYSVSAGDLWSADRNFCTRGLMCGIARRGAAFLVRQHGQMHGERLGTPTRQGVTRSGTVSEQAMLGADPVSGETMPVRRLTLARKEATRDGDMELHLLTHIPAQEARARTLVGVSGKRWTMETAFVALTTTLSCEMRTFGYPKAALFAFCLALVADNAVSVIKAALRRAHGKQQGDNEVSSYYLALEIRQTYDGMMVAIPAPHWAVFQTMPPAALAEGLRELAASVRLSKYRKHPRGPKKKPPARAAYKNGSHVATARLIAQR
jgi:hypothetical protein